MSAQVLPVLELDARKPRQCGHIHGETLREQIQEIAEIRLSFMLADTGFTSVADVLDIAKAHLPLLKTFDEALYLELIGIAEASNLSPERIVVLNHYTDMRDLRPHTEILDGGCSVVYMPARLGPIIGQTWDIHGSAQDYLVMLRIQQPFDVVPPKEGEAMLFSIAGCLGMTGLSSLGVAVCINNLNSYDARIGVVWPALVRKMLRQKDAETARDLVLNTRLGSGHHYTMADPHHVFGIETSGTKKKVTQTGSQRMHYHTNHCLDEEMAKTHGIRKGSTTYQRYEKLESLLPKQQPHSPTELMELFGEVSAERNPQQVHQSATCGAIVMDLNKRHVTACKGPPSSRFGSHVQTWELHV